MSVQISWYVELEINPAKLGDFRVLTGEMVASARREAGTLSYERYVSADGRTVHVYERYVDSDAAVVHLGMFAEAYSERFAGMATRKSFTVFGTPSVELREMLDPLGASYMAPLGGFCRLGAVEASND